jgi:hypothetical protein
MFKLRSSLAWFYEETFRWGLFAAQDGAMSPEEVARTMADLLGRMLSATPEASLA